MIDEIFEQNDASYAHTNNQSWFTEKQNEEETSKEKDY
jgi:hypothetical protein